MTEAQTTFELKALQDIKTKGGGLEDFAKLTGSDINSSAFIGADGKQMNIDELIKQRERTLSTEYSGKKSDDYKAVVDKEVAYRTKKLEEERKAREGVFENPTPVDTTVAPPVQPAEIQTQAAAKEATQPPITMPTTASRQFITPATTEAEAAYQQTQDKLSAIKLKFQEAANKKQTGEADQDSSALQATSSIQSEMVKLDEDRLKVLQYYRDQKAKLVEQAQKSVSVASKAVELVPGKLEYEQRLAEAEAKLCSYS